MVWCLYRNLRHQKRRAECRWFSVRTESSRRQYVVMWSAVAQHKKEYYRNQIASCDGSHSSSGGAQVLWYLDNWLVLASFLAQALLSRDKVLALCDELGFLVNHKKSHLVPSWEAVYLGMRCTSVTLKAFLTLAWAERGMGALYI